MTPPTPAWIASSRREFLWRFGGGLGGAALAHLLNTDRLLATEPAAPAPTGQPHHRPRARRVIQLFMNGGASQMDLFDYKPALFRQAGETFNPGQGQRVEAATSEPGKILKPPFEFRQHGDSSRWVSSVLPHLSRCVDQMAFLMAMQSRTNVHGPGSYLMNTGFLLPGFPCLGAWVSYGLGSENQNLQAFVVLPDPRQLPAGGAINWTSGFLPAVHQGVAFRGGPEPIPDLDTPATVEAVERAASLRLLRQMNERFADAHPTESALGARIRAYELAAQMQLSVPGLVDLGRESESTRRRYGLDHPNPATAGFARNCLLARRLSEQGVRFVQILNGGQFGSPRINWDGHEDIVENHRTQAITMDQPVALYDAVLGGKVPVRTPEGTVSMTIPAGSNSGKVLRLKGRGAFADGRRGDLLAKLMIILPEDSAALVKLAQGIRDRGPIRPFRD